MPFRINNKAKWSTWSVNWCWQVLHRIATDWIEIVVVIVFNSFESSFLFLRAWHRYLCPLKNDFLLCAVISYNFFSSFRCCCCSCHYLSFSKLLHTFGVVFFFVVAIFCFYFLSIEMLRDLILKRMCNIFASTLSCFVLFEFNVLMPVWDESRRDLNTK